jgi:hypothetical protein
VSFTQQDNDIGYYTAEYIGLKLDPSEGEWEVSSSTSERSVILHPSFDMFAVDVKGDPQNGKSTKWKKWVKKDKDNEFVAFYAFAPEDIGGIESYLLHLVQRDGSIRNGRDGHDKVCTFRVQELPIRRRRRELVAYQRKHQRIRHNLPSADRVDALC